MSPAPPATDSGLRQAASVWLRQGRPAFVVEVIEAQGSTPRGAGARMLVGLQEVLGTLGGGHLELQAIALARESLLRGDAEPRERRFALGPSLGQCCGGTVTLRWQPLTVQVLQRWPEPAARFHLQLHGAGHVGRAIVEVLKRIDCRVQWIDERAEEFPESPLPPHVEKVCLDAPEAEVAEAPPSACFLVLTHSHDLDLRIVEQVLRRGDARFLGLIGSKTKRARFEHRLREKGFGEEAIGSITCPIGLPGIEGKEPGVIAVAAVAQLLALRPAG